jgi:hypothetical protein
MKGWVTDPALQLREILRFAQNDNSYHSPPWQGGVRGGKLCRMNFEEFVQSVSKDAPPNAAPTLQALWFAKKGNWDRAHQIAQDIHTTEGSWIHAYLHRVEGDVGNAQYWYSRAGKPLSKLSLDGEWEQIVEALL